MKISPKAMLVISVVVMGAAGLAVRDLWLAPKLQARKAGRTVAWLEHNGMLQAGEVLFQSRRSALARQLQDATRSHWNHCGVLVRQGGAWMVLEAADSVVATPLAAWIARGQDNRYAIRRLRASVKVLSDADLERVGAVGRGLLGAPGDAALGWGDERMYSSELVWKLYYRALGVEVGQTQKRGELDWTAPSLKGMLESAPGAQVMGDDSVVSPQAIYKGVTLETVSESL